MSRKPQKKQTKRTASSRRSPGKSVSPSDIQTLRNLALKVLNAEPRSSEVRRAEILEAVVEILSKEGVDELTFEKIGRRVKMARSHVVYYFPNREELVVAAIRFAAMSADATIRKHVERSHDWREELRNYIVGNFQWIGEHPAHATVYTLLYYRATYMDSYRELHSQIRDVGADRVKSILEKSPLGGKPKQIAAIAKSIQGIITGNLIDVMTTDQRPHLAQRRDETIDSVEELVAGVLNPPRGGRK